MRRWYANKTLDERRAWIALRDPEKVRASDRRRSHKRRQAEPEKIMARRAVHNALRKGELIKMDCEMKETGGCSGRVEAHHDDYSLPLDVIWLCVRHHARVEGRAV